DRPLGVTIDFDRSREDRCAGRAADGRRAGELAGARVAGVLRRPGLMGYRGAPCRANACQLRKPLYHKRRDRMISRREWLGTSLGAGAALALTPELLRALQQAGALRQPGGKLIQRAIPSTGELLPVISYGPRPTDGAAIKEVLTALADNGGR